MKITSAVSVLAGLAGLILSSNALGCGDYHIFSLARLARRAMSTDPDVSTAAIAQLRAAGPAGLNALFELYEPQISAAHARGVTPVASPPDEEWPRIKAALEAVAQQRDCEASKLFWYTDLDQAKA